MLCLVLYTLHTCGLMKNVNEWCVMRCFEKLCGFPCEFICEFCENCWAFCVALFWMLWYHGQTFLKVKMGFVKSEKGFLGYIGFRGSIVRVLTFCDFAKRVMRQRWVAGHGYYIIHLASVCKNCFRGWTWVRWWGPDKLSSPGLRGKTLQFVCIRDGPCWSHLAGYTLARLGDPESVTWWPHLVRVVR